ncbi:hypothetical protein ACOSP7_001667 [Xanthoceras sorbifolium]|uniref:Uncharacterized protein n=1 Tax=Xanthoceras sorbifolium TaxID=99658 RepID=A0ABQ8IL47_9ROSI|nr:hypothetical protein JRO89_XS01G0250100 [Xanthoceras sorbifolium]
MADRPIKRQKLTNHQEEEEEAVLLPGLPDDIAQVCLSNVRCPSLVFSVCKSWRRLLYSPSFPPFLSLYTTNTYNSSNSLHFSAFDPLSCKWESLPPPPPDQPLLLHQHSSFLSRTLPVQSVSASGNLVLLAATTHNLNAALSRPLLFNPILRNWLFGPPLLTPRRWCAAGSLGHAVYVASGIGSHFSTDVARSVEKWDLHATVSVKSCCSGWRWEKMKGRLKDGRFSRDAVDAVGWRGRLCMVNVKGDAAKEGIVYDVGRDTLRDMPEGMLKGWRGPVAAMDEEILYTVDETKGSLRKYDQETDCWVEIISSGMLVGAQQIAAAAGKVCVVCDGTDGGGGGSGIVVVDVRAALPRIWLLDTPPGFQVLTVHILPRMSRPLSR